MKLYLLKRLDQMSYDQTCALVVRARSEVAAREISSNVHGDEGAQHWLDDTMTSCEVLKATGIEGVIVRDFNAG